MGLEIVRHRPSVTQGEVSLRLNDADLGRFGDDIKLVGEDAEPGAEVIAGWAGRGDAYWLDVAKQKLLARALELVKGEDVAPDRYAFTSCIWDDKPGRYYIASGSQLSAIYLGDGEGGFKTVPELMDEGAFIEMPSWWTPQNRFGLFHPVTGAFVSGHASRNAAWIAAHHLWQTGNWSQYEHPSKVLSVSVETGEVIAAE